MLDQISTEFPDYLPARVYQMRIACTEKQDDNCKERVAAILKQDPTNFDALLQDGVFKLASGDVTTAAREFAFLNAKLCPECAGQIPAGARQPAAGPGYKSGRKPKGPRQRRSQPRRGGQAQPQSRGGDPGIVRAQDQER